MSSPALRPLTAQQGHTPGGSKTPLRPRRGPAAAPPRRCRARQAAFLQAYRVTATLTGAAKAAKIGRRRHYHWIGQDPDYRRAFAQVRLEVFDELQDEAVRRAVKGWLEPVFYQGVQCGAIRRYSDRLLMLLLEMWMPEKYGR